MKQMIVFCSFLYLFLYLFSATRLAHKKQEDLLDLITALVKFNCFLNRHYKRSANTKAVVNN